MAFVKVLKNKAYCSRYQTKFRRRRQGKTDYYARKRLVVNDKDKYESKKYRLVVRRTNRRIIAQVIFSTLTGDRCLVAADSFELRNFGIKAGLTNYAAAYCTGLLVARRLLASKGMADMYKGNDKIDGSYFSVEDNCQERRPFKAYLDVGLVRTTCGNRVFGALKGASDGGLHVPHSTRRFPGFKVTAAAAVTNKRGKTVDVEKATTSFDEKAHRDHIFGNHVQTYYNSLKGNQQRFKKQFANWEKALGKDTFEGLYKKAHAAIRANPARVARKASKPVRKCISKAPTLVQSDSKGRKWLRQRKISHELRNQRVQQKMASLMS